MESIFIPFVKISVSLSVPIFLFSVFCHCFGKHYKQGSLHKLWGLFAVRMLLPFILTLPQIPLQISFSIPVQDISSTVFTAEEALPPLGEANAEPIPDGSESRHSTSASIPLKTNPPLTHLQIACLIWAGGICLLSICHITNYAIFKQRLFRWNTPVTDDRMLNLLQEARQQAGYDKGAKYFYNPLVYSPMLVGLFRPVLLIPPQMPVTSEYVAALKHEYIHAKRKDILYKALLLFAAIVQWFNPFAWLMLFMAEKYTETSCDELVVKNTSLEYRLAYGQILLTCVNQSLPGSLPVVSFAGRKRELLARLQIITGTKKRRKGIAAACLLLPFLLLTGSLIAFSVSTVPQGLPLPFIHSDFFQKPKREVSSLLVVGIDNHGGHDNPSQPEAASCTGTILYVRYDINNDSLSVLQIPRDSVLLPGNEPIQSIH